MSFSDLILRARRESLSAYRKSGPITKRSARARRDLRFENLEGRQLLATSSTNIAIIGGPSVINGGFLPTTGSDLAGKTFTNMAPSAVTAAALAPYDTVVLNVASAQMGCNTTALSAQAKADLVSFVGSGHKLIIYDSECTPPGGVDYSWLPYSFTTNNPGAYGAHGTLSIIENNTLSDANASSPYYIDANYLGTQTDAVGDANVMTTLDSHWCLDMSATNINGVTGPVHTYATYANPGTTTQGLIIYNGLDVDYMGYESSTNGLRKIWVQELNQSFNPVTGLPCAAVVTGIKIEPASAEDQVGRPHTLTATVADLLGNPQVGVPVTFTILSGPNVGAMGTVSPADGKTDSNGQVTFTYVGTAVGTDMIEASYVNSQGQTVHSVPASMNWVQTHSPPMSVDKTFFTHVDTTLSVPAPGALSNDTDTDPEHVLSATLVSTTSHGSLTLNADGSFVYVPAAGFIGQDSFQYKAYDGYDYGNTATVTITVYPPLTITMDPSSDTGASNTDQITNDNTPTFNGTAEVGSVVQLVAQQNGQAPIILGQMTVGADGKWSITPTAALPDGSYTVSVNENHPRQPDREVETTTLMNPVIIDTVGPRVTGLVFQPFRGQFIVTLQDDRSGLNQVVLADPNNYRLIRLHTPPHYRLMVTGVTPSAASPNDPTAAQMVVVQIGNGRALHTGYYVAQVLSGGLVDVAGNALDGEFKGTFPSGNGQVGGIFQAFLVSHGNHVQPAREVTPYIQALVNNHENPPVSPAKQRAEQLRQALLQRQQALLARRQAQLGQRQASAKVVASRAVPRPTTFATRVVVPLTTSQKKTH